MKANFGGESALMTPIAQSSPHRFDSKLAHFMDTEFNIESEEAEQLRTDRTAVHIEDPFIKSIESQLLYQQWLGGAMPSSKDAEAYSVFEMNQADPPNACKSPNTFNWYSMVSKFTETKRSEWSQI